MCLHARSGAPSGSQEQLCSVTSENNYRPGWVLVAHSGPVGFDRQRAGHAAHGKLKAAGSSWRGTISTMAAVLALSQRGPVTNPKGSTLGSKLCRTLPTQWTWISQKSSTSQGGFLYFYICIQKQCTEDALKSTVTLQSALALIQAAVLGPMYSIIRQPQRDYPMHEDTERDMA